jgi:ABC-type branched-subunit amino acid transport system substrate-binding protein
VWHTLALVGGVALMIASLIVIPGEDTKVEVIGQGEGPGELAGVADAATTGDAASVAAAEAAAAADAGGPAQSGGGSAKAAPGIAQKAGLACAPGKNGGATDVGVGANTIKLGATVVETGIGASFLGDVRYGMQAVLNKVNRSGGICGRQLSLKLVDDGWDPRLGGDYIRNLVEGEKVFALAVVPSSEGLKTVTDSGYISKQKVPVVGTDGMLYSQYNDPYIWPVAASTISTMHIMAKHAHDAGATQFGIVYEKTYHFGVEGAFAFNAAVKRLTGADIPGYSDPLKNAKCVERFCGIVAGAASYSSDIQTFNRACANTCDFTALLLEPATAVTWMKGGAAPPRENYKMGGPQPLFTAAFGQDCGAPCDQLMLWTGYFPPLGAHLGKPAVSTYVNDIKATSSRADFNNSFVEGGYVGMSLLVKALQDIGPNVTRENLKNRLDSMDFDSGLTGTTLKWRPGNHFANVRMQAYSIQYKSGFAGWRDEQIVMDDPWVGQDAGH